MTREALIAASEAALEKYADGKITRKQCSDWLYDNGWLHSDIEAALQEIDGIVRSIEIAHAENFPRAGAKPDTEANHALATRAASGAVSGPNSGFDSRDGGQFPNAEILYRHGYKVGDVTVNFTVGRIGKATRP